MKGLKNIKNQLSKIKIDRVTEVYLRKEKVNKKIYTPIRRVSIHKVKFSHRPQMEGVKGQLPPGTSFKGNASS